MRQSGELNVLDIPAHNTERLPSSCLHDCKDAHSRSHHVLRRADAHGVAGEAGDLGGVEGGVESARREGERARARRRGQVGDGAGGDERGARVFGEGGAGGQGARRRIGEVDYGGRRGRVSE